MPEGLKDINVVDLGHFKRNLSKILTIPDIAMQETVIEKDASLEVYLKSFFDQSLLYLSLQSMKAPVFLGKRND